jgi:hypothetical protein
MERIELAVSVLDSSAVTLYPSSGLPSGAPMNAHGYRSV